MTAWTATIIAMVRGSCRSSHRDASSITWLDTRSDVPSAARP
jgi:hypothetical protein